MKISSRKLTLHFLLVLVLAGMVFGLYTQFKPEFQPLVGDLHYHADFKVYLNGTAYDFAKAKYMSKEEDSLSPFTHLHDMDGEIIHKHMAGITLGDFFESIGMNLTETCFSLDDKTAYCKDGTNSLKLYVNGSLNTKFDQYELEDLDQILISYGNDNEAALQSQLDSVGDRACIYSETCPERGSPPDESSCIGSEECLAPALDKEE